jgi:hypothetical protein
MSEDELVFRIKERANDPTRRISCRGGPVPDLFSPTTCESVRAAESKMGFALPSLLARLYIEVANGGFGPGFGLYGLPGGHAEDLRGLTLPELYLSDIEYEWPPKLVTICDWGCTMGSAIDCSSPDGDVVFLGDSSPRCMPEGIMFAAWLEDWVNDVDLFHRAYRRYQQGDRPTLCPVDIA